MMIQAAGKQYQGFTLIETVVAMFIFVLVMAAVSSVFTQTFSGYRNEKIVQGDLEAAQFSLNTMAKELRTASVVKFGVDYIQFYDHSQASVKCFRYRIDGASLEVARADVADVGACNSASFAGYTIVASGIVGGKFAVIKSSDSAPQKIGRVTVALRIQTGTVTPANIQTTVSLRDYGNAGL
ncbi:MAG: prepilin-type N-terminal cleavage/methylation domain-containing protein [Candidatus Moraniibacteriota bacterium]